MIDLIFAGLMDLLQSIINYVYDFFDWVFPKPECKICNPKKPFKPDDFFLKYGLLIFLKIPAILIAYISTRNIYITIGVVYLCIMVDKYVKSP